MLDFFTIFSKGGIVLWCFHVAELDYISPMNHLVNNVLIPECPHQTYQFNKWNLEYCMSNKYNLIFLAGYKKVLRLSYVTDLVYSIRDKFSSMYESSIHDRRDFGDFDNVYKNVLTHIEDKYRSHNKATIGSLHNFDAGSNCVDAFDASKVPRPESKRIDGCLDTGGDALEVGTIAQTCQKNDEVGILNGLSSSDTDNVCLEKVVSKTPTPASKKPLNKKCSKDMKKKTARVWGDKISEEDMKVLDYSENTSSLLSFEGIRSYFRPSERLQSIGKITKGSDGKGKSADAPGGSSKIMTFFKGLVGTRRVEAADLELPLQKMKDHLYTKNVACEIAGKVCDSVSEKLVGQTIPTFKGVQSLLVDSMEEALTKILTPRQNINILNEIKAKSSKDPYVVVFCGVNGVGKSTNLAKIANYLLSNDQKVMIAACDTFRSGAVEQLNTHVARLNSLFGQGKEFPACALFQKGYGKDAAGVASSAIKSAIEDNYNVVLIDTAGRMQDNEPLMKSLAKLIKVNSPDLVLFVGEALVGNDGVDQLQKFNRALAEFSDEENPRLINGIVLTKFDTIDDKVGAALSMTYASGQPIVFVGVGQTYADLRTLDVDSVVKLLLN